MKGLGAAPRQDGWGLVLRRGIRGSSCRAGEIGVALGQAIISRRVLGVSRRHNRKDLDVDNLEAMGRL